MALIYNIDGEKVSNKRFSNKHIAVFFGCDVQPNFIHLFVANVFNKIRPSEVSILLLSHNSHMHHFGLYKTFFNRILDVDCNVKLFDDALFNISLRDVPSNLWDLQMSGFDEIQLPFRKISLYDVVSTIIGPINLLKNFNVDYLFINPFIKDVYKLHSPSLRRKFVYNKILNLDDIPSLRSYVKLEKVDLRFIYESLVPFTAFCKYSWSEFKAKSKEEKFYDELNTEFRKFLKSIYHKKDNELKVNLSGDRITKAVKNFTSPSKIEILKKLKSPKTLTALAGSVGMAVSTVKAHLDEMEREGIVAKSVNKKYFLRSNKISLNINI